MKDIFKNLSKVCLAMITVLVLVCLMGEQDAMAEDQETWENWKYSTQGDEVTIAKYLGTDSDVTIPSTIAGKSVTSIGEGAFYECSNLTSVTIPDSVRSIGEGVFYECGSLTSVAIPNSVTSIGEAAFYYCSSLTGVTIPDSVTSIGEFAFCECDSLTEISISKYVMQIGDYAFMDCDKLEKITVDAKNTVYDSRNKSNAIIEKSSNKLILGCKNTVIPDSVTGIGDFAFTGCSSLIKLTIPNSVKSIGEYAFGECSALTSLIIPDSVTDIGYAAFTDCTGLTSIKISKNVRSIAEATFYDCSSLTSVTIPDSVTNIGNMAFSGCSSLTEISISKNVTSIGEEVFYDCSSLTGVTIPSGVTSIGKLAFCGCSSLIRLIIPDSVTDIGYAAFCKCSGLKSIRISQNVRSIGEAAFYECGSLTSVTIPNSVTSIGDLAFNGCSSLASVTISKSVTNIGEGTFCGCSSLASVILPNSVTSIGEGAFYECSSLESIVIPSSVTSIGAEALDECNDLIIYVETKEQIAQIRDWTGFAEDRVKLLSEHTHTYKDVYTRASTDADGKKESTCSICGDIATSTVIRKAASLSTESSDYTYTGKAIKAAVIVRDSDGKKIPASEYTVEYKDNKAIGKATVTIIFLGDKYEGSMSTTFNIVPTAFKTLANTSKGIKLTWTKNKQVSKYIIYRSENGATFKKLATLKGAGKVTYTDTKVRNGVKYSYKIYTYTKDKEYNKTKVASTIYRLDAPEAKAESSAKGSIKVTWNKNAKGNGYEIKLVNGKTEKTYTIKGSKTTEKTINKLKKGKTYKVYVRSYKTADKTKYYSEWSKVGSVKVKK